MRVDDDTRLRVLKWHLENNIFMLDAEGRIWRVKRKFKETTKLIVPVRADTTFTRNGYRRVFMSYRGNRLTMVAHRVVLALYRGEPVASDLVVHHRNSNRADNRPTNLDVTTPEQNQRYINLSFHAFGGGTLSEAEVFAFFTKRAIETCGGVTGYMERNPGCQTPELALKALEAGIVWPGL